MSTENSYEQSQLYKIRHSASHVMAQAVLEMFPDAKLAIGPPIADGFYYDFDLPRPLTTEDLDDIEARMKKIVKKSHKFTRRELSEAEARKLFADQPYKLELIDDIVQRGTDENGEPLPEGQQPVLSAFKQGEFEDLCRGPHVDSTKDINPDAIKLLTTSGAYWRGDNDRPMLQRIYGTAWLTGEELAEYVYRREEAKHRDHRTLGKALDLFGTSDDVGPGLILWHPKGATIRFLAERFSQEAHLMNGYDWVNTPHIGRSRLWEISGHLDFFKEGMFPPMELDGEDYYVKPMNCPFHIQIYKSRPRSYRELPLRFAEYGTVYRNELSGVLQGLTRVRGFTQDDAHHFCMPSQAEGEISHALRFSLYVLKTFGFKDFTAYVSTRPEGKAIGSTEDWDRATETLKSVVQGEGVPFEIDEGGGAFYGPKIDLKLTDSLGREWQLSTVQFDFNLPDRFDMEFVGDDNKLHRPVMVHRALFGSAERFFAMLIEHFAGAFPLWLAPVQVVLVPIADRHVEYARSVEQRLRAAAMRTLVDDASERMNAKIRRAQMNKVPYVFVMGDKEMNAQTVSVRSREDGDVGVMSVEAFLELTSEPLKAGIAAPLPA